MVPDKPELQELHSETRILLPGTQVFLAFLTTVPFAHGFGALDPTRRGVFAATFFTNLLALVLFVVPATYHRIARPVHQKERYKAFANHFVVAGLVPMSASVVLAAYLVAYVTVPGIALPIAIVLAALIAVVWWVLPVLRLHERERRA